MRTEVSYLPCDLATDAETDLERSEPRLDQTVCHDEAPRLQRVSYFRTGEAVPAGDYTCTYCGHRIHLSRERALPLCGACDTDEFMANRTVAPTRPRRRLLVAA